MDAFSFFSEGVDFTLRKSVDLPLLKYVDSKLLVTALRRAKAAGKRPGRYFGGITLPSCKRAFAVYERGEIVERYAVKRCDV